MQKLNLYKSLKLTLGRICGSSSCLRTMLRVVWKEILVTAAFNLNFQIAAFQKN